MSAFRTALEDRIRPSLYSALFAVFNGDLANLAASLEGNPNADEILRTAESRAQEQATLWTAALISTVSSAFDSATIDSMTEQIDHNVLLNYDPEKHFLQTEIIKISETITGILQSVAGTIQGTEFTFGDLENNKFLKLVNGVIVSGTVSGGGGTPSDTVEPGTAFGQASSAGTSEDYQRGDHKHGTPANPVPAHSAQSTNVHGVGANSIEHTGRRGAANGYAGLNAASKVPALNLGGAGSVGTKYLKDDLTWNSPVEDAMKYALLLS